MHISTRTTVFAATIAFFSQGGLASADVNQPQERQIRLGLHTPIFDRTTQEADVTGSDSVTVTTLGAGAASLGVTVGYVVGPAIEIGGILSFTNQSQDGDDFSGLLLGGYGHYNHALSGTTTVFGEGILQYGSQSQGDFDFSQLAFGVGGGAKMFVVPNGSIDLGLRALILNGSADFGGTSVDVNGSEITIYAGISIWLGGSAPSPGP